MDAFVNTKIKQASAAHPIAKPLKITKMKNQALFEVLLDEVKDDLNFKDIQHLKPLNFTKA